MLTELFRDLRFGARLLRRSPGFTFTALVSLALGIGGTTAVFSLVNAIVLRTLPVPDPQQLHMVEVQAPGQEYGKIVSGPTFLQMRDAVAARNAGELFAATGPTGMQLQPGPGETPMRGTVQLVSGEYFTALRQQPQVGRLLTPADNITVNAHPVAVVSDGYWRRIMNAAPDAVGRTIMINGASFTVIGITQPRFFGTTLSLRSPDAWIPFTMQPAVRYNANASNSDAADTRKPWPPQPNIEWLNVFVRVPDGTKVETVVDTMTMAYRREREAILPSSASADDRSALQQRRVMLEEAAAGISTLREGASTPLFVLLSMVAVLLAIACGNVAGLLLSRAAGREREIAIRLSIGAGRGRLVRQLLAESLLLSIAGGLLGITFAVWARDGLLALMVNVGSTTTPIDLNTAIDWRVLGFSLAVSVITGVACGMLPAIRGSRVAVADSLKQQSRASVGAEGGRRGLLVGKALVTAQMAFCLLLLVVAGLFARSLQSLTRTDVGFDRDHVLAARVDVRGAGYGDQERLALYRRVIARLEALPGVQAASVSAHGPLVTSQRISSLTVEGYTAGRDERLRTNEELVSDRYFETVGLRLIDGRLFTAEDRAPGARTSIINATMARRFFPGQSAVGKRWSYGDKIDRNALVVVGVVEDARYTGVRGTPPNMVYRLIDSSPDDVLSDIEVRTSGDPAALIRTVRETLTETEPRLPIIEVVALRDRIARGVSSDRMVARLTSMFGALALLLASLGLYGTISYGISRRVSELGLRMALGADRSMVLWMVLREALTLVVVGAVLGLPMAFLAGRSMRTLLYNVPAADPWSFSVGAVLLVAVAAVAAYLPAHRASRIEPMVALGR
jgi:predicted permease